MIEEFRSKATGWRAFPMAGTISTNTFDVPALQSSTPGAGEAARILAEFSQRLNSRSPSREGLAPVNPPRWLEEVYSHVARAEAESAVDVMFTKVNEYLVSGAFLTCNELLRALDLKRVDTNAIVAALSITLAAADRLPYRKRFLERATLRLGELAPGRVGRLLNGLR